MNRTDFWRCSSVAQKTPLGVSNQGSYTSQRPQRISKEFQRWVPNQPTWMANKCRQIWFKMDQRFQPLKTGFPKMMENGWMKTAGAPSGPNWLSSPTNPARLGPLVSWTGHAKGLAANAGKLWKPGWIWCSHGLKTIEKPTFTNKSWVNHQQIMVYNNK